MKTRKNTSKRRNALDGPFTAIARAQARSWDINIVPSGSTLATDGNTIYFPWNSDDIDTIPLNVLHGYLDHETGHIAEEREHRDAGRETPLELTKSLRNITKRMLLNVYEDIRMELKRGRIYPGVAANLKAANEYSVDTFQRRFSDTSEMKKARTKPSRRKVARFAQFRRPMESPTAATKTGVAARNGTRPTSSART